MARAETNNRYLQLIADGIGSGAATSTELRNAATDDRALVGSQGGIPTFGLAVLPVLSSAAAPTLLESRAGYISADLSGAIRITTSTVKASATFTRPADTTAYASGDLVANSTTAGSVTPMSFTVARVAAGSGRIRRVRIRTSSTSLTNASFRLHLYGTSPTVTNGDNGAWLSNQADTYLGALDAVVDRAFSDGAAGNGVPLVGAEINFKLASGLVLYGLLEARAAYTPTSAGVFAIDLEVQQN